MYSETTILGSSYIPVFYSVYTINNVTLCKINYYRRLKQSEIFGSVLTGIFTLTSKTEADRFSDFHFGFDDYLRYR